MSLPSISGLIGLVTGLTEVTKSRAQEAANSLAALVAEAPKQAEQLQELADELFEAARHNREGLLAMVREEVAAAVAATGANRNPDVERLREVVAELTHEIEALRQRVVDTPAVRQAAAFAPAPLVDLVSRVFATQPSPASGALVEIEVAETSFSVREDDGDELPGWSQPAPAQASVTGAGALPDDLGAAREQPTRQAPARTGRAKKATATRATTSKAAASKAATAKAATAKTPASKAAATKAAAKKAASTSTPPAAAPARQTPGRPATRGSAKKATAGPAHDHASTAEGESRA